MKLFWANSWDLSGIALGYSTHQKMLRKGLERNGVEITEDPKESDIAIHIVTPEAFIPTPGKFNILYTMYEMTDIPDFWVKPLNAADLIVVPCRYNKTLLRRYTNKPIEVCWEGVDQDIYTYKERTFPRYPEQFWYLFNGASNPRKGYELVVSAWRLMKIYYPELAGKTMLYLKTTQKTQRPRQTGRADENGDPLYEWMPRDRFIKVGDAIVDTRKLPYKQENGQYGLRELYHMAHCFVIPSMGEGFGLTHAEAAATGLPVIYTPWSGPTDFLSAREAYPVKWAFQTARAVRMVPGEGLVPVHSGKAACADVQDVAHTMAKVYYTYETALKKGKRAAERIRKQGLDWDTSAKSFARIVEKHTQKEKVV